MVEIGVLGPVQVLAGDRSVPAGPPQRRLVLAALAIDAGRAVSPATLADRVWGEDLPTKPRAALHAHMTAIRRTLAAADPATEGPLLTFEAGAGGYRLRVEPGEVDLHRFRRLVSARSADPSGQLADLRAAVLLWRGEALSGLPGPWARQLREGLRREHLAAVSAWALAETEAGFPEAALGPIGALLEENPLDERLAAGLIRALHGTGDTAGALRCYAETRTRLVEQLGLEPGPELRGTQESILRGGGRDREAERDRAAAPTVPPSAVVPAQVPAAARAFTGRAGPLDQLDDLLGGPGSGICVVTGMAGVGKTALAVHWAHRSAVRFPDGQLYVNLRGYDPEEPLSPVRALAGFLAGLGVPARDIPVDADELAARYRTETAGRRMLVLLDNASSPEQVRPLLPGSPDARVLVTSRDALPGLVAVDGARRLELEPLPTAEAVTLLRTLLAADPPGAEQLADRCARLPLALRLAAEFVLSRPGVPLSALVEELDGQRRRLDLLDAGGDARAAVRAVFSWSYQHLTPPVARLFRLAGLHPAADLDAYAAAALAGCGVAAARTMLGQLARAHLLEPGVGATPGGERYVLHDLLRAYAAELAAEVDAPEERRAALERLWGYYVAAAAAAADRLFPAEAHRRAAVPPAQTPVPDFAGPDAARRWLDRERPTLALVTEHAAERGWPDHAVRLAGVLVRYLTGGHFSDALTIHGSAVRAARQLHDPTSEALALLGLGGAQWRLGRYAPATDHLREALALYERTGDDLGQARTLDNMGTVEHRLGSTAHAVERKERALVLFRQLGDRVGEARVLAGLGDLLLALGRHRKGSAAFGQALELFRRAGDRLGEGAALDGLGMAARGLGRPAEALQHHLDALTLFRELGYRTGEAHVLDNLGDAHADLGRAEEAGAHHREALALHRETGDRRGEVAALNGLGEASTVGGAHLDAVTWHRQALALSEELDDRPNQAQAQAGLGRAYAGLGDADRSRRHLRRALSVYTALGHPAAGTIRAELLDHVG